MIAMKREVAGYQKW